MQTTQDYSELATQGFFLTEKNKTIPMYRELAHHAIQQHHFCSTDAYLRHFNGTHYERMGKLQLGKLVGDLTVSKVTGEYQIKSPSQKKMFEMEIKELAADREQELKPTDGLINLKNGILDVQRSILFPHSPDYNFLYCLPYEYNPLKGCPEFMGFLRNVFDNDEATVRLVQHFGAYILTGGAPFIHTALCLTGEGRNGKSTLLDIISAILGENNVSSVALSKIHEPFHAVGLEGKLANIVEESPVDAISPEAFKNIIGGGKVTMAKKFQDNYSAPVSARFLFATNDTPRFKDTSVGLYDRIMFVNFPRYFSASERDYDLKDRIIGKELSGILNWFLEVLPLDKRARLEEPEVSKFIKKEYVLETNSVADWCDEKCDIRESDGDYEATTDLFNSYRQWCFDSEHKVCNDRTFGKRLKSYIRGELRLKYGVNEKDPRSRSGNERRFRFITLRRK